MIANYHTHNELCGHAGGTLEEYVIEALRNHFTEIGMSDHIPFPDNSQGCRMPYSSFDYYIEETNRLKQAYEGQISVKLGGEIEFVPEALSYYHELLEVRGLDYLLMAGHSFQNKDGRYLNCYNDITSTADYIDYAEYMKKAMATGFFVYLAHPDLPFMNDFAYDDNTRRAVSILVEDAVKNDYILELNANGFRRGIRDFADGPRYPYPVRFLWEEVAKTDIRVMIGSDCHSLDALNDDAIKLAEDWVRELNLNLVEKLPLTGFPEPQ